MSVIINHLSSLPTSSTHGRQLFGGIGQRTIVTILAWRSRVRQRRELMMLNCVELRELSLNEADVNREISKPFWADVNLTNR